MAQKLEKLKGSRYYGFVLLFAMLIFFYGVFKILTPHNFGSPANLYSYLQSSIIYAVGGCGLYFIVVMGLFDFAVGSNIVLSSIVGVILSKQFGYPGFILGCLGCGTLIGTLIGYAVSKNRYGKLASYVNSMAFLPYLMPSVAVGAAYFILFSSGKINQTELAGLLIVKGKDFVDGIENIICYQCGGRKIAVMPLDIGSDKRIADFLIVRILKRIILLLFKPSYSVIYIYSRLYL